MIWYQFSRYISLVDKKIMKYLYQNSCKVNAKMQKVSEFFFPIFGFSYIDFNQIIMLYIQAHAHLVFPKKNLRDQNEP